ncbi:hypothetical protein [Actinocrispum wychmicini]|uniref:SUKH-3 immunity protein of toxin-antitoxin system n=1 Tax=Actinocrispum wychmicini TaxID=1213861 RepID=A0A4R2JNR7_9PSEU|nr:hypothetical protein [Actinocrispum wychmicini]TCO60984.1 hypothetical protein EV192_103567 [Actinocrispum wychmicini]
MNGLVASVLTDLFGPPEPGSDADSLAWTTWRSNDPDHRSRLYRRTGPTDLPDALLACYGDFGGGFLIGSSIKMATIDSQDVHGLYRFDELAIQPELSDVRVQRPELHFFLDAANVWFYGIEGDTLVAFDADLDEITDLGDPAAALPDLLTEWLDS